MNAAPRRDTAACMQGVFDKVPPGQSAQFVEAATLKVEIDAADLLDVESQQRAEIGPRWIDQHRMVAARAERRRY